jgi:hypothetical protein
VANGIVICGVYCRVVEYIWWGGLLAHALMAHRYKMSHVMMAHAIMPHIVPLLHAIMLHSYKIGQNIAL